MLEIKTICNNLHNTITPPSNKRGSQKRPPLSCHILYEIAILIHFNPQSVISQSLTIQQNADGGLPHISKGYRFLSARH